MQKADVNIILTGKRHCNNTEYSSSLNFCSCGEFRSSKTDHPLEFVELLRLMSFCITPAVSVERMCRMLMIFYSYSFEFEAPEGIYNLLGDHPWLGQVGWHIRIPASSAARKTSCYGIQVPLILHKACSLSVFQYKYTSNKDPVSRDLLRNEMR